MLLEAGSARIPQVCVGSSPSCPRGWRKAPADATAGPVSTGGLSRVCWTNLMTPGEPGGGGGLVRLPCAVKPGTPPCAGLSRGPRLLGPCPSAALGPGYPSLQPGSAQVKGEMQEDRHSCPAAAGPRHCSGSPFHLLPCPRRPCRKDRQRNRPPCSGRQLGVGGAGAALCCPQVSDPGQDGSGSASRASVRPLPAAPPPPHPAPSERCAASHLWPHSPRSVSRPKAKSGLSRTQSECPWQSFPSPWGPWWKWGSCPALGRGATGAPES